MEAAHRGVTGVETRTNGIIAKLPVDRGAGEKFECFKFNAWSPLLRKFKVDGDAEGDVVTKNHAGYPLSWVIALRIRSPRRAARCAEVWGHPD
jgi:hypothetical protein